MPAVLSSTGNPRQPGFSTARTLMTAALTVALGFVGLIAWREHQLQSGRTEVVRRWEQRAKSVGECLRRFAAGPQSASAQPPAKGAGFNVADRVEDRLRRPAYPRVVILLDRRKLQLLDGDRLMGEWEIRWSNSSQANPVGCLPTGHFYVCDKTSFTPRFRYLALSYPGIAESDRALAENRISATQAASIRRAIARRLAPPRDTPLGGPVAIQGTGQAPDASDPPSQMSLVMADADIAILYRIIEVGDPVEIVTGQDGPPAATPG